MHVGAVAEVPSDQHWLLQAINTDVVCSKAVMPDALQALRDES